MKLPLQKTKRTEFGSCCKELKDAMTVPPNSLFHVSKWGVLYLTVGYVQAEQGLGWMDQAVIFCPFCGKHLQTREEIRLQGRQAPGAPQ
jgi:hypothetical protein